MGLSGIQRTWIYGLLARSISGLKESRDLHASDSRNAAGKVFHLVSELIVYAPRRFVHGRANQILQHLLVFARKDVRLDAHVHNLLLAVHLYRDHSAAARSFYRNA